MGWVFFAIVALLVIVFFIKARATRRLLSIEHFRAIHAGIEQAVSAARGKVGSLPDTNDGTAFLTPNGLAVAVSYTEEQATRDLHISFSQPNGILSPAVASRIAGLIVVMLSKNAAELTPHVSKAGVFHLAFQLSAPTIVVNPFDQVQPIMASKSPTVPFLSEGSLQRHEPSRAGKA